MKIAYDAKLKRPGCAILQAFFSATPGIANRFPTGAWLTAPTDDMKLYEVNDEQLKHLILMAEVTYGT